MSTPQADPTSLETQIHLVRGQRVMLGPDLAKIFGVPAFRLNQAVKRNAKRFPEDFTFQLTSEGLTALTSQIVMSKTSGRGGRRTLPYAFTEHGALMLANVLNSSRAVEMSIYVMRAFVRLRALTMENKELAEGLRELERQVTGHDQALQALVATVRRLMDPRPLPDRPRIGFSRESKNPQS